MNPEAHVPHLYDESQHVAHLSLHFSHLPFALMNSFVFLHDSHLSALIHEAQDESQGLHSSPSL